MQAATYKLVRWFCRPYWVLLQASRLDACKLWHSSSCTGCCLTAQHTCTRRQHRWWQQGTTQKLCRTMYLLVSVRSCMYLAGHCYTVVGCLGWRRECFCLQVEPATSSLEASETGGLTCQGASSATYLLHSPICLPVICFFLLQPRRWNPISA